jgi:Na+/H+ antiporter NhaD/arsenite permease-like protein
MPAATPEALDALIAASLQSRREALLRSARRQRIATKMAFGGSACVALLALTAYIAGEPSAAVLCAFIALVTFSFACVVWKASRKTTADSFRKMKEPS